MVRDMTVSDARRRLTALKLDKEETVAVTSRGKRVLALMPWDTYESVAETLEILGDPRLVAKLRRSMREAAEGKLISHEQIMRDLS